MASYFLAAPLGASPSYPNCVAWSKDNLVAVASGHLITILNPASLKSPGGLITLPAEKPFPIGFVEEKDLNSSCLLPISLSRDIRPCARSISWSPPGFASNYGCLLAVCTMGGHVRVYCPPFHEVFPEWVEAMDISDTLYCYLQSLNLTEQEEQLNRGYANWREYNTTAIHCVSHKFSQKKGRRQSRSSEKGHNESLGNLQYDANGLHQDTCTFPPTSEFAQVRCSAGVDVKPRYPEQDASIKTSKRSKNRSTKRNEALPRITARKYVYLNSFMSSLTVAWSPIFHLSEACPLSCSSKDYAILAVGSKSGDVSFWSFGEPARYTIENGRVPVDGALLGLLQAHKSWITAMSWGLSCHLNSSFSHLIFATGSSDGSVKIWLGDVQALMKCRKSVHVSFSLFKEVTAVTSMPISIISLVLPEESHDTIILAVGKGSGVLEVWICNISCAKIVSAGVYDAHDRAVTGLSWAFDGACLYSCSQDNSVCSWILCENQLHEVPFPASFTGIKNKANRLQISDPCFGIALSPSEAMIALVRSFDTDRLNQMYQARRQKAAVEFYLIGGQFLAISSDMQLDSVESLFGQSKRDLLCWESNILWSLRRYENEKNLLAFWDILATALVFKKSMPFVDVLFRRWISSWFPGLYQDAFNDKALVNVQSILENMSSRKLHLINVVSRRLMLIDMMVDGQGCNRDEPNETCCEGEQNLWKKLLLCTEQELRERLVSLTFYGAFECKYPSAADVSLDSNWFPVGIQQMERWASNNVDLVHKQIKHLGVRAKELKERCQDFASEETCIFCSASVPFESPEYGLCNGTSQDLQFRGRHRLSRCAVSMKLCPATSPTWHCICCQRLVAILPPPALFRLSSFPEDGMYNGSHNQLLMEQKPRPFCPFCGILLQGPSDIGLSPATV